MWENRRSRLEDESSSMKGPEVPFLEQVKLLGALCEAAREKGIELKVEFKGKAAEPLSISDYIGGGTAYESTFEIAKTLIRQKLDTQPKAGQYIIVIDDKE